MDDFAPVRTERTFEIIANKVRDQIRDGKLRTGDKLPPERALAQQFGTSRNAVREALRSLEHVGLISLHKGAHGGAFITDGDPSAVAQSMEDLMYLGGIALADVTESRLSIETAIVEIAAANGTTPDFDRLDQNIDQVEELTQARDMEAKTDLNIEFHVLLAEATGNPVLVLMPARALVFASRALAARARPSAESSTSPSKGFRAKAPPSARYPLFLSPRTDASSPPRTPSSRCQVKTEGTDGYNAVQVGYDQVADYKITKPEVGHCAKAGVPPMRHLEEFRLKEASDHAPGQQLKPSEMFKEGDVVDVRGTSIGKGWQGAVKKYGFSRGLMTHGSKSHRQHGSVGAGTSPGRIFPGKKMHSQMGNETVTARKLKVMRVEDDCIIVKGSVPGKRGNLLRVAPAKIVGKTC